MWLKIHSIYPIVSCLHHNNGFVILLVPHVVVKSWRRWKPYHNPKNKSRLVPSTTLIYQAENRHAVTRQTCTPVVTNTAESAPSAEHDSPIDSFFFCSPESVTSAHSVPRLICASHDAQPMVGTRHVQCQNRTTQSPTLTENLLCSL